MEPASKKRLNPHEKSVRSGTDCATCKRRRIKCDRSPGACRKCSKRSHVCPGYGQRVQWVNDVATRGRLKGLQAAYLRSQEARYAILPGLADAGHAQEIDDGIVSDNDGDESSTPDLSSNSLSPDLHALMCYYKNHVARLMVWIDSEDDNPYQTQVLCLVSTSPVLRLAISAISTLHWNAKSQGEQLALPEDIRDEAVLRITASVKDITDSTTDLDLGMAQWMLASMMVLSCCEMIKAGAMAADWHRRAARALVNVVKTMTWCDDELLVFLMNQLAAYDVLSCTTSFDLADVRAAILPPEQGKAPLFSQILRLIHGITLDSRRCFECSGEHRGTLESTLSGLRCEIEMARGETLMAAANSSFNSQSQQRDFVRLVDLYCKATFMYAHRACYDRTGACDKTIIEDFFRVLDTMEQTERSCQNLAWPLFIAGTGSRGNPDKQRQVVGIFDKIHSVTGFDHFRELTEFLTPFWSGSSNDWLSQAEEWAQRGKRILAV